MIEINKVVDNFTEEQRHVIQAIRSLEIRLRKKVNQIFVGEHHSVFKGQGMEFNEVRKYVRGDDTKNIDWKVTARTNELHVKTYQEERELVFNILYDISGSQFFGSGGKSKKDAGAEIAATLAFATIKNRDKIGFFSFTEQIENYLAPDNGKGHVFKIINKSLLVKPEHDKSNLKNALTFFSKTQKKTSVLFIISDFLFENDYFDLLRQLVLKHSIIIIHLQDRLELSFPSLGYLNLTDMETGQNFVINTRSKNFRRQYEDITFRNHVLLKRELQKMKVKYLRLDTGKDYLKDLSDFFRRQIIR